MPSSFEVQAPAVTTACRAVSTSVRPPASTVSRTPSSSTARSSTLTSCRMSAPRAAARRCRTGRAASGFSCPPSGMCSTSLVEPDAAPAFGGFRGTQEFGPQPGPAQGVPHVAQPRIGAVVHDAGARQEALAAVGLELVPQPDGLGQHRHVVRIGVAGVEVPGGAVRRAVAVPRAELFQQGHVPAAAGQGPGGRRAHGAASDDDGVQMVVHGSSGRCWCGRGGASAGRASGRAGAPRRSWPARPRRS